MSLAGAVILILAMANALINFVVQEQIPGKSSELMLGLGLPRRGSSSSCSTSSCSCSGMVMDGFSAILVAVPLVLPFAARFHLHPFHLAVMFLLEPRARLLLPPLGLNLFISSFRFDRPVVSLYRVVLPFAGLVALGLVLVMYVPRISTVLIATRHREGARRGRADQLSRRAKRGSSSACRRILPTRTLAPPKRPRCLPSTRLC